MLPDVVSTILQQIKTSNDNSLRIIRDFPVQTKAMTKDKTSILTTTTQGASIKSLSKSDKMSMFHSED
eukprot:300708-Ditylum_brightwellii.AAC.1